MLGGLFKGAVLYLLKPVTMNDLKNLWQFSFMNKKTSIASKGMSSFQKSKRKIIEEMDKNHEKEDKAVFTLPKKQKVVWTNELHSRFLLAVKSLGIDGKSF